MLDSISRGDSAAFLAACWFLTKAEEFLDMARQISSHDRPGFQTWHAYVSWLGFPDTPHGFLTWFTLHSEGQPSAAAHLDDPFGILEHLPAPLQLPPRWFCGAAKPQLGDTAHRKWRWRIHGSLVHGNCLFSAWKSSFALRGTAGNINYKYILAVAKRSAARRQSSSVECSQRNKRTTVRLQLAYHQYAYICILYYYIPYLVSKWRLFSHGSQLPHWALLHLIHQYTKSADMCSQKACQIADRFWMVLGATMD